MLKLKTSLFAALLLTQAVPGFAANLISVTKNSGFVAPNFAYHIECSIGPMFTMRRTQMGPLNRVITRTMFTRYTLEVPTPMRATRLLGLVANGRIAMTRGHTDGPTSSFYGFYNMKKITLLVDQSIRTLRNTAPGANALLQFAERNCPIPQQPTL